jgi:uncharacterized membrane protein
MRRSDMVKPFHHSSLPPEERNSVIAVYADHQSAEDAVRDLEHAGYDMKKLSLLARGLTQEQHVIGTDTRARRTGRWAAFGTAWGALFGSVFWIPGIGGVAVGGYLLWILAYAIAGAASGALGGALSSIGVPHDGVLRYETDLKADKWLLIAHGTSETVEKARQIMANSEAERVDLHLGQDIAPTNASATV